MTALTGVISYPIPIYQNLPIEPQFYLPSRFVISGIILGQTTTVTTSVSQNYVIGQLVRLLIPPAFGCRQLNNKEGIVLSILSSTQVILDIYSLGGDSFVSSTDVNNTPQVLAIGDVNSGVTNNQGRSPTGTFIPGSFINISPL